MPDIAAQVAVRGLRRRLQALALDVEQPAMEGAAQAAVFETSIGQVGAPMWAGAAEEPVASLLVAEDHELFSQKLHRLERPVTAEFVGQSRRLPKTPQHLSRRFVGTNAGDAIILVRAEHNDLRNPALLGTGSRHACRSTGINSRFFHNLQSRSFAR